MTDEIFKILNKLNESKIIQNSIFHGIHQFNPELKGMNLPKEKIEEIVKNEMIKQLSEYILSKKLSIEETKRYNEIIYKQELIVLKKEEFKQFVIGFIKRLSPDEIIKIRPDLTKKKY